MVHPLVTQLWFARSELNRCLEGVSAADAVRRIEPMNCLSWIVGHLSNHEHYLWVVSAQHKDVGSSLYEAAGFGQPELTPAWDEMWQLWQIVTQAADVYLKTISPETVRTHFERDGKPAREDIGTSLLRNIYHYWFHLGEAHAIRQQLGHPDLPQFVGNMSSVQH